MFSYEAINVVDAMEKLQRNQNCNLVDYAVELGDHYRKIYSTDERKEKGQFFTNKKVAVFMANLFDLNRQELKLLDPGAGTGILSAAVCDRIIFESEEKRKVTIDCYEPDSCVIPCLKRVLSECKNVLESHGHEMDFYIYQSNFVLNNANYDKDCNKKVYDLAICNPPYYKLRKDSEESLAVDYLKLSPPNIYSLFMFFAAKMLSKEGQMVFIVPRSFCSGLYYKKIRKWLVKNLHFDRIHLFESRKDIFDDNEVLQENIIFKAIKKYPSELGTTVSYSLNKDFEDYRTIESLYSDIVFSKNGDSYIRIPTSERDLEIIRMVDEWEDNLNDLDIEISTGPVVDFRTKENLNIDIDKESVPLLWMHNLQGLKVIWPYQKGKKEQAIKDNEKTNSILVPIKNYVLLKRFTSKEQKHRLDPAILLRKDFQQFNKIGFENHLNYLYKKSGELSEFEAYGIAAILKNNIADTYFRTLNGNTQVNASEIRNMPFPQIEKINEIGQQIVNRKAISEQDINSIILRALNIKSIFLAC
jgi:Type I restriction-modification system methyltransferase subunit